MTIGGEKAEEPEKVLEVPSPDIPDVSPGASPFGSQPGVGEGAGVPGVLSGGSLMRVARPNRDDIWLMVYEFPPGSGKFVAWQFDDIDQVTATFGEGWETSVPWATRSEKWFRNRVDVMDQADEIIGTPGNFNNMVTDLFREVTAIGGFSDPAVIADMLRDDEIRTVVMEGTLGGWDEVQITQALRQTGYWQNVLYPGISTLYGVTASPEQAWVAYQQSVESSLSELGIARDDDGSYRTTIGRMLNEGIDEAAFLAAVPVWQRAATNQDYYNAFSKWVRHETNMDLAFDDWFDLIAGTASQELVDIANRAAVAYEAQMTGFNLGNRLIEQIAEQTTLDEAGIASAFSEVEQRLLAMGDVGLRKYGLSRRELIQATMGIETTSGRSMEEVRLKARQAAIEAGLLDDEKAQLFVSYDVSRGTPYRPGLNPFAPERA